ncbi:MAG: 3-dehydroquinate synthase [Bacteroidales bacterium]
MHEISLNIDGHVTTIQIGRNLFQNLESINGKRLVFLVDENVHRLHTSRFEGMSCLLVPSGEKQKTLSFTEEILRKMVFMEADRTSFLVGVGGGLVTDLAGFVASVFMRGIDFGFISSTLLGQVDASIGGKNGVNLDGYKNMVGVFRQPKFVWCDMELLDTLDQRELTSGFSEVIKYAAIRDLKLFDYIEVHLDEILKRNPVALEAIVTSSVAIKADIVQADVNEQGERKLLNFGHTLGHAIEKLTGMMHGEAVAIGMVLAARLSCNMGFLDPAELAKLEKIIVAVGLPVKTDLLPTDLYETLLKDKKRTGDQIHFILLRSIGEAFIYRMELNSLRAAIHDLY